MFSLAQLRYGLRRRSVGQKLEPAEPLHGHDAPAEDRSYGRVQCLIADGQLAAGVVEQLQMRPTGRTGDRLRVKSPVGRVFIFRPAGWTHGEAGHRGPRAVVRQLLDDRPPRPAVGAIGKRIPVTPLGRVADFGQALMARCQVRRDRRPNARFAAACLDPKAGQTPVADRCARRRKVSNRDRFDSRLRRRRVAQGLDKRFDRSAVPLDIDLDRVRLVPHPAAKSQRRGRLVNERTKPDPLHDASDFDRRAANRQTRR